MSKSKLLRMDNVSIIVENLEAMIAFFAEIGLEVEGRASVEGPSVDRLLALRGTQCDVVTMRTPDGHSRIELSQFRSPAVTGKGRNDPVNTLGIRRIMFAVEDLREVLARLVSKGAKLLDEVVQYEDSYLLCYVRGPEGILVALAQAL